MVFNFQFPNPNIQQSSKSQIPILTLELGILLGFEILTLGFQSIFSLSKNYHTIQLFINSQSFVDTK